METLLEKRRAEHSERREQRGRGVDKPQEREWNTSCKRRIIDGIANPFVEPVHPPEQSQNFVG